MVVKNNLSTYPPVDGVGELTVLPELLAKRWRLSAFSDCLHNDVAELHKSAVSLSRLSIQNYVLVLIPNSPLLFLEFLSRAVAERATKS